MREFLKQLAKFTLCAFLVYTVGILMAGQPFIPHLLRPNLRNQPDISANTFTDLENIGKVDVLFVGSSHCYRGFDTRVFAQAGIKSFNLGSSSQTPVHSKILLDQYLPKLKPRLIVFEVYPLTFTSQIDKTEAALNIIANERAKPYLLKYFLTSTNVLVYNSLLFKFLDAILGMQSAKTFALDIAGDHYAGNGYVEKDLKFYKPTPHRPKTLLFDQEQFTALNQVLSLSKKHQCKVLLVFAPITKSLYHSYTNKQEFDERMQQLGNYINFNESSKLEDAAHFFDDDHLNQKGVVLFNEQLIEVLNNTRTADGGW